MGNFCFFLVVYHLVILLLFCFYYCFAFFLYLSPSLSLSLSLPPSLSLSLSPSLSLPLPLSLSLSLSLSLQILSVIFWMADSYFYYAGAVLIIFIVSMFVSLIQTRRHLQRLHDMVKTSGRVTVIRDNQV